MTATTRTLVGRECRFAIHVPSYHPDNPDIHVVKEQLTFRDEEGNLTQEPNLRLVDNFKRPFWFTIKTKRNHKQKKEWESLENLSVKYVTQSDLRRSIAHVLEMPWSNEPMKKLLVSPYIYGADISSSSLLKKEYMKKWPDLVTPYTRCIFDTETDVNEGHEEIQMATAIFNNTAFIVAQKKFLGDMKNVEELLQEKCQQYIGEHLEATKMVVELAIVEDVVELMKVIFARIHSWKPDWLVIWNMKFDIGKILDMCTKYDIDPKSIFCDPDLPEEYKICKYIPGQDKQTTASGKVKPINPAAQWHTLRCTASFYVIDAMCAFRHLRLGEQEEPSYSLDAILGKVLNLGKLKFEQADHLNGSKLAWHSYMQKHYKIEYMVYNIFDCLSMVLLDDKLKDLGYTLPSFAQTTDFDKFKSNPRKIVDELHYFALEQGFVMGTAGYKEKRELIDLDVNEDGEEVDMDDVEDDDDEENTAATEDALNDIDDGEDDEEVVRAKKIPMTLSLRGWICTLPSHNSSLGLKLIKEDRSLCTNIRTHAYDSDEVSAYPTATVVANVSMSSTKREIIDIKGVKESVFRMQNLNMVLGTVNSMEYSTTMFGFPKPDALLLQFQRDHL